MAVCDDWEFVLAVSADYPDMLDAAQLHSVHIVNQAVVGKRFQLRTCDRIRYFKDNRLISLFCNPRFQHGIEVCPAGMEDISHFPIIWEEMRKRGFGKREISMIAGANFLRVMRDNRR